MERMPATTPATPAEATYQPERHCVACGYNLYGLGEEPRCPECGLLNVPDGFRRQVWELVDSGKWFFSGFFSPFKKRPPGWWWSLDRPGDVKRAALHAIVLVGLTTLFITTATALDDAARVNLVQRFGHARGEVDANGQIAWHEYVSTFSVGVLSIPEFTNAESDTRLPQSEVARRSGATGIAATQHFEWRLSRWSILYGLQLSLWAILTWLLPAGAGLCTQIRKGIPPFAQAPRTVFAAALHESHRLLYLMIIIVFWTILDALIRQNLLSSPNNAFFLILPASLFLIFVGGYSSITWVGALRADYTRQLIRSRFHAIRIVIVYAIVLPTVVVFAISMLRVAPLM